MCWSGCRHFRAPVLGISGKWRCGRSWLAGCDRGLCHEGDSVRNVVMTAVVGCVVGLLLAGCAQPEASPPPSLTKTVTATPATAPTPTVTASATPGRLVTPRVAPTMPAEAKDLTAEGALAFTQYWFDVMNWMIVTNDEGPFTRASSVDCAFCDDMRSAVREDAENGIRTEGALIRVNAINSPSVVNLGRTEVEVNFDQEEERQTGPSGSFTYPGNTDVSRVVILVADGDGWMVLGLGSR